MKLALYKGHSRLISRLIRFWTQSPYSHCELVFSDGKCGSSHDLDCGVGLREIQFNPDQWDFFEVNKDEASARQWFEEHSGMPYDYLGLLGFVIPLKSNPYRWTCSKAVMTALGYEDAWRFDPGILATIFKRIPNDSSSRDPSSCTYMEHRPVSDTGSSSQASTLES